MNSADNPNHRPLPWQVKVALALLLTLMVFMVFGCATVPAPRETMPAVSQSTPVALASIMPSVALSRAEASLAAPAIPRWLQPVTNGVTLAWIPSIDPNVVGYILYAGTQSGIYTNSVNTGNVTNFTYFIVRARTNYPTLYFVCTAYDAAGQESEFSNEAAYSVPRPPPTPVLTGFILTGHSLIQQSSDLVNWSMPITLDGSLTNALADGNHFWRGTNLNLTPVYSQPK